MRAPERMSPLLAASGTTVLIRLSSVAETTKASLPENKLARCDDSPSKTILTNQTSLGLSLAKPCSSTAQSGIVSRRFLNTFAIK